MNFSLLKLLTSEILFEGEKERKEIAEREIEEIRKELEIKN